MSTDTEQQSDELERQVKPLLEKLDDKDMDWARELFQQKLEEVEEKLTRDIDEEQKRKYAIGLTRSEISNRVNLGETQQIQFVSLGYNSPLPFDPPLFRGHGIAILEDNPAGKAIVRLSEDDISDVGLSFQDLRDMLEPFGMLNLDASIRKSEKVSNSYVIDLQGNADAEVIQPTMSEDEMRDLIDSHVDEVTLQEVGTNLSMRNEDGYPEDFGIDIKKIPDAYIADLQVGENSARYVIQDETVVDPEELDETIRGDDVGMTVWLEKDLVEYDTGSILDIYGVTKSNPDGQVMMNAVALDPILPQELDRDISSSGGSGGSNDRDENVKERSI